MGSDRFQCLLVFAFECNFSTSCCLPLPQPLGVVPLCFLVDVHGSMTTLCCRLSFSHLQILTDDKNHLELSRVPKYTLFISFPLTIRGVFTFLFLGSVGGSTRVSFTEAETSKETNKQADDHARCWGGNVQIRHCHLSSLHPLNISDYM